MKDALRNAIPPVLACLGPSISPKRMLEPTLPALQDRACPKEALEAFWQDLLVAKASYEVARWTKIDGDG